MKRQLLTFTLLVALTGCWEQSVAPTPSTPVTPVPGTVTLSWDPVVADDLAGYRVYFGTTSGAYAQPRGQGLSTKDVTFVLNGLQLGVTYYFAVTSYDVAGNESAYSSEVSKFMK